MTRSPLSSPSSSSAAGTSTCCTTRAPCSSRASSCSARGRSSRRCRTTCPPSGPTGGGRRNRQSTLLPCPPTATSRLSGASFRSRINQAIPDTRLRDEPGMRRVVVQLLAQLTGVDAQVLALAPVLGPPHFLEDGPVGQDPARPPGEEGEKGELLGRQLDLAVADGNGVAGQVDLQVSHPQQGIVVLCSAVLPVPQGHTNARQQLGGRERLGHVVVGAFVESEHLAVLRAFSRQHHDADLGPLTDAAAHL